MDAHHAGNELKLITISTTTGGRIHLTRSGERTLCHAPILDTAILHEGDWCETILSDIKNSSIICARCRTRNSKEQSVITPNGE